MRRTSATFAPPKRRRVPLQPRLVSARGVLTYMVTAIPVFTATPFHALTVGSSSRGNHCITMGPTSVTTTAPPRPKRNRLSRKTWKVGTRGPRSTTQMKADPARIVHLRPSRRATAPVTIGAMTLAIVTTVKRSANSVLLTWNTPKSSLARGEIASHETPKRAYVRKRITSITYL
jgi:hypothetical protein